MSTPQHHISTSPRRRLQFGLRGKVREATGYWWVWLVSGIAWLIISLVLLQFDDASVTTIGVLVGFMFLLASVQNFSSRRWPNRCAGCGRCSACSS